MDCKHLLIYFIFPLLFAMVSFSAFVFLFIAFDSCFLIVYYSICVNKIYFNRKMRLVLRTNRDTFRTCLNSHSLILYSEFNEEKKFSMLRYGLCDKNKRIVNYNKRCFCHVIDYCQSEIEQSDNNKRMIILLTIKI